MKDSNERFMSTIKVGSKGQIVIPKEIRTMFGIEPGNSLIIMADQERGIAIQKQSVMEQIAKAIFAGKGPAIYPREDPEHLTGFADAIHQTVEESEKK